VAEKKTENKTRLELYIEKVKTFESEQLKKRNDLRAINKESNLAKYRANQAKKEMRQKKLEEAVLKARPSETVTAQ
jgi:uncharacterized protein (UPF0335 family)